MNADHHPGSQTSSSRSSERHSNTDNSNTDTGSIIHNRNSSSNGSSDRPTNPYQGTSHAASVSPVQSPLHLASSLPNKRIDGATAPIRTPVAKKGVSSSSRVGGVSSTGPRLTSGFGAVPPHGEVGGDGLSSVGVDGSEGWRNTVEYRAAWDLEVWKAVQAERFRRQLEKHKITALEELRRRMKVREKQELAGLMERRKEAERREEVLKAEELKQRQQRSRLEEGEKELAKARHQLLEAQKRVEEEIRVQVRRANEDFEHKSLLLRDQVKMAESQTKRLEERLARSEADYLVLFEEFHRFRTEHVTLNGSASPMTSGVEGGTTTSQLLLEGLRARHAEEMRLLQDRLEQKASHEIQDWRRRYESLEQENKKLVAALARRREQLRISSTSTKGGSSAEPAARASPNGSPNSLLSFKLNPGENISPRLIAIAVELDRLQRERSRLIEDSGGALDNGDAVVDRLSARIATLMEEWNNHAPKSSLAALNHTRRE